MMIVILSRSISLKSGKSTIELKLNNSCAYGSMKPELELISIPLWVVTNTCIFNFLLSGRKLPTLWAKQDFLAYSVEIME